MQASLAGGYVGAGLHDDVWPKSRLVGFSSGDVMTLGLGGQLWDFGVLLAVKAAEFGPSGYAGVFGGHPYGTAGYVHLTYGATDRGASLRPTLYAYSDIERMRFGRYDNVHVGVGAKWRFYVVSPDLSVAWQRVRGPECVYPPIMHNFLRAAVGLELGGLWAFRLPSEDAPNPVR